MYLWNKTDVEKTGWEGYETGHSDQWQTLLQTFRLHRIRRIWLCGRLSSSHEGLCSRDSDDWLAAHTRASLTLLAIPFWFSQTLTNAQNIKFRRISTNTKAMSSRTERGVSQRNWIRLVQLKQVSFCGQLFNTRVGTLIVATIYLQLIQNRYMFRSFTVLQCSHQHCVQPVASDVEVVGYL